MTTVALPVFPPVHRSIPGTGVRAGNLELHPNDGVVVADRGRAAALTARELDLLLALVEAEGRVVPRAQLYESVWRRPMSHRDRSVDVFVRSLRHKLAIASPGWRYIHTRYGVGYRFFAHRWGPEDLHHSDTD